MLTLCQNEVPPADLLDDCETVWSSNHSRQLPQKDCRLGHGRTEMMEDDVLAGMTVAELEPSSFQSSEQTGAIEHHGVDREPSLVFWWSFGRATLLLHLMTHQPCDKSSNIVHLLDDLELEHEVAGQERAPPQRNLATAIRCPPGLA